MKVLKVIANCCCVFLAVISLFVSLGYCYYHFVIRDEVIGINNINDQIALDIKKSDELTTQEKNELDERWFMQANYYSNAKNNGIELQELQYNYFTGYELTSNQYRSTGMQYIGNFETYKQVLGSVDEVKNRVLDEFYYYDTTNGVSWNGFKGQYGSIGTMLNRDERFIIKIDNRPFEIQLTGSYNYSTYKRQWYTLWLWNKKNVHTVYYDYGDVFDCVFSAIKSLNKSYGDYYITVDLSHYFSVREYDTESDKFKRDDVSDVVKNYAVLKFHYDENGAVSSNQSLFGSIECNSKYNVRDTIDTEYWQERMVYDLNTQSKYNGKDLFVYRYSEVYDGYFISLSMDGKELFANMPRAKVNITIDLQSQFLIDKNINLVGCDYNAFENFKIDTLTILGNEQQTLYVLDKALYNSQLQILKHSACLSFDLAENSINNECMVVAL